MKKKIINEKLDCHNNGLKGKMNDGAKKKIKSTQGKIKTSLKSIKKNKQISQISIKISTPPLVSKISKLPDDEVNCNKKKDFVNHDMKINPANDPHITVHKSSLQKAYNKLVSDYQQVSQQNQKSSMRWKKANSACNDQIFHQYGYSNISHAIIKSQNDKKNNSLKKQKNKSQKSQIQLLMAKYRKHIDKDNSSSRGSSKSQQSQQKNFRTLSTDDKSQNHLHLNKNNNINISNKNKKNLLNKLLTKSPIQKVKKSIKVKQKKNKKRIGLQIKKQQKSKTLLPDYFGCLSINKVQSHLQTLKSKQQKQRQKNNMKLERDSSKTTMDRFRYQQGVKKHKVYSARQSSSNFMQSQRCNSKLSSFKKKVSTKSFSSKIKQRGQISTKKI